MLLAQTSDGCTGCSHSPDAESAQALVSRIIPFSCVDGPGNRFVIFLQGCNFQCKNCHNPHSMNACDHCGDCLPGCPSGALSMIDGAVEWDTTLCQSCDQCIDICPKNSTPMAQNISLAEVIEQLLPAAPFLTGVTVSGGEATMQLKFIQQLFRLIKNHPQLSHLDRLIDSNGYLGVKSWQKILPDFDGAMIDIKAIDDTLHQELTGRSNQRVLESIHFLDQHNKLTELRFLAIPDVTDHQADQVAAVVASLSSKPKVRVNAFSNTAVKGEAKKWRNLSLDEKKLIEEKFK